MAEPARALDAVTVRPAAVWHAWLPAIAEGTSLAIVAAVALALRLPPLAGYPHDYDEGIYWQGLRAMSHGQPLVTSIYVTQPPGYLLSLYPLYRLFGQTLVAARLATVVYSLIALAALYGAGRLIAGRWAGVAAAALLAVQPLFSHLSAMIMAEIPSLAFETVAMAAAVAAARLSDRRRLWLAGASGAALALGVLAKLLALAALVPIGLYLLAPLFGTLPRAGTHDHDPGDWRVGLRESLLGIGVFAAGLLVVVVIILLPFAAHLDQVYAQTASVHLSAAQRLDAGLPANLRLLRQQAGVHAGWPLALAASLAAALAVWRRAWSVMPPLCWFGASVVLVLHQQPLFYHHLVVLAPPLALLGSLAVGYVLEGKLVLFRRAAQPLVWGVTLVPLAVAGLMLWALATSLSTAASIATTASAPVPADARVIMTALQASAAPKEYIVGDDQFLIALADRNVPPELCDTSLSRALSGNLTAAQLEASIRRWHVRVVYFGTGRFDAVPGFGAWVRAHAASSHSFGAGRVLYTLTPP